MLPVKTTAECPGHDVLQWADGANRHYAHCFDCKATWEVRNPHPTRVVYLTPPGFAAVIAAAGCFDKE